MKITLACSTDARGDDAASLAALSRWYDTRPAVRRLWAIRPDGTADAALRVIVMLEPSLDGNDPSPRWMAHGPQWARELGERIAGRVQLERIDGPLPEEFEIEGEGVLLSALGWRDSTLLQD